MNLTDLALEAASYITASGSPAANNATIAALTVSQKRRMANDLTAVMQFIAKEVPDIYQRRDGATLAGPVTATATVSIGSKSVTTAYGYAEGATVSIGGKLNEIRTEGGAARLLYPSEVGGAVSAIFYGDSIELDETVSSVIGSIWPEDTQGQRRIDREIKPLQNRLDAHRLFGGRVGCPRGYWVDSSMRGSSPGALIVTGAITPDATGLYLKSGIYGADNDNPGDVYVRVGGGEVYFLYDNGGGAWAISNIGGNITWFGPGPYNLPANPSPLGTYISLEGADASGTATVAQSSNTESSLRLRFLPLPDAAVTIGYDVRLRAPSFSAGDLGTDSVPSTKTLVVPDDYHASLVRPLFLEQFSSSPWWRVPAEVTKRVMDNANMARKTIEFYRYVEERVVRIIPGY